MSAIAEAQEHLIHNARVIWHAAISALDEARASAELLQLGHLMQDDDFYEAIAAIDGMTTLLGELIEELP